jgi:hypothetical protein
VRSDSCGEKEDDMSCSLGTLLGDGSRIRGIGTEADRGNREDWSQSGCSSSDDNGLGKVRYELVGPVIGTVR